MSVLERRPIRGARERAAKPSIRILLCQLRLGRYAHISIRLPGVTVYNLLGETRNC